MNTAISDRPDRASTEQIISLFEKNSPALEMQEAFDRVRPEIDSLRSGKCTLVVIGEIKKGKSSLINALLGLKNVLPVSSDVATATVFRVVYGMKRKNVVVLRSKPETDNALDYSNITADAISREFDRMAKHKVILTEKEVTDEELFLYGAEDGNPENEKGVDHIRIEIPCEALRNGLEIIDTPGLGGLMKAHADITWGYIPNAQAVLFVLESVQSPFTKDERLFLSKIKAITPRIIFAQTKIDVVDAAKWKSWRERNLEEIAKVLGIGKEQIPYFPISSEDKQIFLEDGDPADLESSGFGPLENFIFNRLLKLYEQVLCQNVLERVDIELSEKEKEVLVNQEIVTTDAAKLVELDALYTAKQVEFGEFESEELPELITQIQDRIQDMIADGEKELNDFLQPNQYNPVVDRFIEEIRGLTDSPKKINEKIDELSSYFTDACAKRALEIYAEHQQRIIGFVSSEFNRLDSRLKEICDLEDADNNDECQSKQRTLIRMEKPENALPAIIQKKNDLFFAPFDMVKSVSLGASVGGTIGAVAGQVTAIALGALFPVSIPFAGPIIGGMSALGSFIGGILSHKSTVQQERQKIISHFQQALPGILLQFQKSFSRQYSDVMNDVRRKIRDEQRRITKTMKQRTTDRLLKIRELRKNEGLSVDQRRKKLSQDLNIVKEIRKQIRRQTENIR